MFSVKTAEVLAGCNDLLAPVTAEPLTYYTISDPHGKVVFMENERYVGIKDVPKNSDAAAVRFDFDPFFDTDWNSFAGDVINADTGEFVISGTRLRWLWNNREFGIGCSKESSDFLSSLIVNILNDAQDWVGLIHLNGFAELKIDNFDNLILMDKLLKQAPTDDFIDQDEKLILEISRFKNKLRSRLLRLVPQLSSILTASEDSTAGWNIFTHDTYGGVCTLINLGDARILDFSLQKG